MSMIHQITSAVPRYKRGLRKGRGESSGHGKTSGRGTKGAKARQGQPYWKVGHEGGQTPLHRRLPTRGFSNDPFESSWQIVNVSALEAFDDGSTVDGAALAAKGLLTNAKGPIKILGDGALTRKLTVLAGWYSRSAAAKIAAAGGVAQNTKGEEFVFPKPKPVFVPRKKEKGKKGGEAAGGGEEKPAKAEGKGKKAKPQEAKSPEAKAEEKKAPDTKPEEPKAPPAKPEEAQGA